MKDYYSNVYDTIILGSGYTSVGYALAQKNTLILEQGESADTTFYLALTNFNAYNPTPTTKAGKSLYQHYASLNLFKAEQQNLNAFECAFCDFIINNGIEILFKTRVFDVREKDEKGIITLTALTVCGVKQFRTKNLIDARPTVDKQIDTCANVQQLSIRKRFWSVLVMTDNPDSAKKTLTDTFNGAIFEPAFFENRYALHIPVGKGDFNQIKIDVLDKWTTAKPDCKILYFAPVTYFKNYNTTPNDTRATAFPLDCEFTNPISAIDSGYTFATTNKGGAR